MADSKMRECRTCRHYDCDECACMLHQSLHFPFETCGEWAELPKLKNVRIRPKNYLGKDSCLLLVYEVHASNVHTIVRCVECKLFASKAGAIRHVNSNRDGYSDKRVYYLSIDQDNGYVASFVECGGAPLAKGEGSNDGRR